jgi:hypothetical protein
MPALVLSGIAGAKLYDMMKPQKVENNTPAIESASSTASKLEADAAAKASAELADYNKRRKSQSTLLTSEQGIEEQGTKKTLLG